MKRLGLGLGLVLLMGCDYQAPMTAKKPEIADGAEVFARVFTDSTGLGPLFNGASCADCHEAPVLGGFGEEVERVDLFTDQVFHEFPTPEPTNSYITIRDSNDLFNLGDLEIPTDEAIRAYVAAEPRFLGFADGKAWYNSPVLREFPDGRLGRFGRKCQAASLHDFVAAAFANELGIQPGEILEEEIDATTFFVATLVKPNNKLVARIQDPRFGFRNFAVPPGRAKSDSAGPPSPEPNGRELFQEIGCAVCHNPATTYTDFALHVIAPEPDSGDGQIVKDTDFRTEPLTALGLQVRFMHDGESLTLEDAIARHGHEAGFSRAQFNHLPPKGQAAVLAFLRSL